VVVEPALLRHARFKIRPQTHIPGTQAWWMSLHCQVRVAPVLPAFQRWLGMVCQDLKLIH